MKNRYKNTKIFIGYSKDYLTDVYFTLYKTSRTNANDGGIDFLMKSLGRFFQVTEVNVYDKFRFNIDKVMNFPITLIALTKKTKEMVNIELDNFIIKKTKEMKMIKDRCKHAIEEVVTINELIK